MEASVDRRKPLPDKLETISEARLGIHRCFLTDLYYLCWQEVGDGSVSIGITFSEINVFSCSSLHLFNRFCFRRFTNTCFLCRFKLYNCIQKMGCVMHPVLSFRQFGVGVYTIYLLTFGNRNSKVAYQPVFSTVCFVSSYTELLKLC